MRRRDALRAGALLAAGGSAVPATAATAADESYGPLGRLDCRGTKEAVVSADGSTAFLALTDGYATVDVRDPAAPTLLAERRSLLADREGGPMVGVHDVTLSGDTLAVVGPANPAPSAPSGALFVDVSDPADPVRRGFHPTTFPVHNAFLDGEYLYLTGNDGERNPLVVVDAGADPPAEVARWSLVDRDPAWGEVRSPLRVLHDVWVRDGLAALACWDAGTYLLDVSDPADPAFVGRVPAGDPAGLRDPPASESLTPPGNHHYAATDPGNDLLAVGEESWAARRDGRTVGGPSGVGLYDLSDPAAPAHLASIDPPPTAEPTLDGTWTTAHNLELRGGTLYTSWYQGGVKRHDVSDPANPVEETWWVDPAAARFWTARTAGDAFVASSMGTRSGAPAGLWTFPDAAGGGGDPAALTATPTTAA
ncbi:LVIVD repeat-containing protein, partial [Candidatus Halobonum tyrrellensis]